MRCSHHQRKQYEQGSREMTIRIVVFYLIEKSIESRCRQQVRCVFFLARLSKTSTGSYANAYRSYGKVNPSNAGRSKSTYVSVHLLLLHWIFLHSLSFAFASWNCDNLFVGNHPQEVVRSCQHLVRGAF